MFLIPLVIHGLGRSFLSTLRRLCSAQLWEATSAGNGAGCQVTFKTVWSKSACSTRRTEAALWFLPSGGSIEPEKKKAGLRGPQQHKLRGNSKHYGLLAPFLNVPQIFPIIVIGFPSPSFLRGLTVLPPNSYLEKADTSQIKLRRGFLAPESDGGNSAYPTNLSSPDVHCIRTENLT